MILKVFLKRKILRDILVEYLGNISGKNLKGITREISGQYFWKEVGYCGTVYRQNFPLKDSSAEVGHVYGMRKKGFQFRLTDTIGDAFI